MNIHRCKMTEIDAMPEGWGIVRRKSTEYDAGESEMKLLVLQETDWIKRGLHQQHHLMDRMTLRGEIL